MSGLTFTKAVKAQEKLRLALDGPSGAGKTWTSLTLGQYLAAKDGGRMAVIDSERSSAKKYASYFDFDHLTLPDSSPHTYIAAIEAAVDAGYSVIVIDSLSHAWEGTLALKDEVAKRSRSNDSFGAWREVTPIHNSLVDTMLRAPAHVIATMRSKTEYVVERDNEGKTKVSKIGLKPVQRDGVEFEFDVVGDMDQENTFIVSKTRCHELAGAVMSKPGDKLAELLWKWLTEGEPPADPGKVAEIKARVNALGTEARRQFLDRFGHPDQLLASHLDEAVALVVDLEAELAAETADAAGHTPEEAPEPDGEPDPVPDPPPAAESAGKKSNSRFARLFALLSENNIGDDLRKQWATNQLGRQDNPITSFSQLTDDDISQLVSVLADGPREPAS